MALKSKEKEVCLIHLKWDFSLLASVTGLSYSEFLAVAKKFMRELTTESGTSQLEVLLKCLIQHCPNINTWVTYVILNFLVGILKELKRGNEVNLTILDMPDIIV